MAQPEEFELPLLTVDVVLFTLKDQRLHVLLPVRDRDPYEGMRALVGGVIHTNEDKDTHAAARRVAMQKIGVDVSHCEQLAMFSGMKRDPRRWSATMAYIAMIRFNVLPKNLTDDFFPVDKLPPLAFDHTRIVTEAVKRLRNKASYSTLPLYLLNRTFTLFEVWKTYEHLMGQPINKITFKSRMVDQGFIVPTGKMSDPAVTHTRPAELYRSNIKKTHNFDALAA
jgi:8-oxo-dGTP diphosphatase